MKRCSSRVDTPLGTGIQCAHLFGPVAQLGARFNRTEEVAGSNPARSTNSQTQGPMAQLGARFNGIEEVVGSNPTGSTSESTPVGRAEGDLRRERPASNNYITRLDQEY